MMRLPGLDGVRAISIALVLAYHVMASEGRPWDAGIFGVEIFFVLSGFLITWLLCSEERLSGSISLPAFYARRALRIIPPATTYLATLVVLAFLGWGTISLREIASCLFFVRNLFGGGPTTGHYWSLSVEEQFYLLWPALMVLVTNRTRLLKIACALLLVEPVWRFANYHWLGTATSINPLRFDLQYNAILVGCCLALLRSEPALARYLRGKVLQSSWTPLVAMACAITVVGMARAHIAAYIAVAVLINYAIEHPDGWGRALNWGPIPWVGRISYSLYIWQQLFCWKSPLGWFGHFPQNLLATFAMASLSYYFVEQPFAKLRKRVRHIPNPALFPQRKLQESFAAREPT
jgi:peptidoglycan/LPS O-acetylase OafA/YrhL